MYIAALALPLVFAWAGATSVLGQQSAATDRLSGSWVPEQIQREGLTFPPETFKGMQFTFSGDRLVMAGFPTPKGDVCAMKVDLAPSPKHLDCTLQDGTRLAMAWDFKNDRLQLAVPSITAPLERPTSLESKPDSGVLLITLQREAP